MRKQLDTKSPSLVSTEYNKETESLTIEMGDGETRFYHNVPEYKYLRLLQARNKGKYFYKCIESQFRYGVKNETT